MWWHRLALSRAAAYREHVAVIWELSAVSICFILYVAAVLAIFLRLNVEGRDPSAF